MADFAKDALNLFKTEMILFPPQDYFEYYGITEEEFNMEAAEAFTTTDMDDKPFGVDDIASYDLTMVNVWFTGCTPCIKEMPLLQDLYTQLPENVNMVTVCLDAESERELALEILDSVKATFRTLKGEPIAKTALKEVTGTPTTFFLDTWGRVVGTSIIGAVANEENFVAKYLEIIQERLDSLKK